MYERKNFTHKSSLLLICLNFVIIIVTLSLFVILIKQTEPSTFIQIDNINSYLPNMPNALKQSLFQQIYQIASKNTPLSVNINTKGASIMKDSLEISTLEMQTYGSFLITLENINQEYKIQYEYGDEPNGYPVIVTCNNNATCISSEEKASLNNILPYSSMTKNNTHWIADKGKYYSPNNLQISTTIDTCDNNENIKNEIKESLISLFKSDNTQLKIDYQFSCYIQY